MWPVSLKQRSRQQQLQGVLLGGLVAAACTAYFFWGDEERRAELAAFDWRIKHAASLEPDPRIVHVDIDDGAVDRIGRWPWKRRDIADLIRVMSELGPKLVLVDFLFSEPEPPYYEDPRLDARSGLREALMGELSQRNAVYGDMELAEAIRASGNTILSLQLEIVRPKDAGPLAHRLDQLDPPLMPHQASEALARLGIPEDADAMARTRRELTRLRLRDELVRDFSTSEELLAQRVGVDAADAAAVFAGAKRLAAREIVRRQFETARAGSREIPSIEDALKAVLGDDLSRRTADRSDLADAYQWVAAEEAARARGLRSFPRTDHPMFRVLRIVPPLVDLARGALDVAAVNFSADSDGIVRRVPIFIRDGENAGYMHMGLAGALHALGLNLPRKSADGETSTDALSVEDGLLRIPAGQGRCLLLPLDRSGGLVIHWTRMAGQWRSGRDMPHVSAAKLMSIVSARRSIRDNEIAISHYYADVVAVTKGMITVDGAENSEKGASPDDAGRKVYGDTAFRKSVNALIDMEQRLHGMRLRGAAPDEEMSELSREIESRRAAVEKEQKAACDLVTLTCMELSELSQEEIAADPKLKEDADRYRAAKRVIDVDIAARARANETLRESIRATLEELRPVLADKFVFLGFAATAQGDIVSTPIDSQTNGVMCHAHVMNALLRQRPVWLLSAWAGAIICLLGGILISALTAILPPRSALLATLGLMLAYAALNIELFFKRMDTWVVLAPPLVCAFLAWAFVTLYRQLTAERDKRLFAKQLAQYTSPAIAARIAESPEAARAFKTVQTREVTCFFSDLAGFTTLSEAENPESIQHVLNTYLHRMSQVIWAQRGLLNKFMGDGIMAFFNASVDPMEDHPRAAVETALLGLEELERLKEEMRDDPAARIFRALEMRIGLASGAAKNGDMGSELKADYTVIGDVVNLAARLEPANKVFGTRVMVSGPTREAVREHYEFRYLAELQVKGKAHTVPVYEVICRKGGLTAEQKEYIERFEAGVALYKERKWDECIVHFTRLLARRIDDAGASRYIDACQEFKTFPPDDAWRGALELKEK